MKTFPFAILAIVLLSPVQAHAQVICSDGRTPFDQCIDAYEDMKFVHNEGYATCDYLVNSFYVEIDACGVRYESMIPDIHAFFRDYR